jgi:hypothetical protein
MSGQDWCGMHLFKSITGSVGMTWDVSGLLRLLGIGVG